ncbi:MAG: hypothetical protein ACE5HB_06250, partial [Terriglobia bacterium]
MSCLIEMSKLSWMLGAGQPWSPGAKLRLLLAGYNGARNTGSDVRVEEMLRQLRRILGENNIHLSVMTQNFHSSRGYFGQATQVKLPDIFPPFLYREVRRHHGVLACEGSMFKSKFANALTTMMIGSLGIASVQNKLSVGYGAEAGDMDPLLAKMCRRYCGRSLVITRNEESRTVLRKLGVPTEPDQHILTRLQRLHQIKRRVRAAGAGAPLFVHGDGNRRPAIAPLDGEGRQPGGDVEGRQRPRGGGHRRHARRHLAHKIVEQRELERQRLARGVGDAGFELAERDGGEARAAGHGLTVDEGMVRARHP